MKPKVLFEQYKVKLLGGAIYDSKYPPEYSQLGYGVRLTQYAEDVIILQTIERQYRNDEEESERILLQKDVKVFDAIRNAVDHFDALTKKHANLFV